MLEQQLVVGRTYRFTFKSEFERHGVCSEGMTCLHKGNGIFMIQQIATYPDILLSGVNLYANFFEPLGISKEQYQEYFSGKPKDAYEPELATVPVSTETVMTEKTIVDGQEITIPRRVLSQRFNVVESGASRLKQQFINELSFASYPIYKLVDVVNIEDVLYVPEMAIKGVPEVGILEYQNLSLMINLGYWENPDALDGVLHDVRERLAIYGIQPLSIDTLSADSKWMNPDEYAEAKSLRVPGVLTEITTENEMSHDGDIMIRYGKMITLCKTWPAKDMKVEEMYDGVKLHYTVETDPETGVEKTDRIYYMLLDDIKTTKGFMIDPTLFRREIDPWKDSTVYESGMDYFIEEQEPGYAVTTDRVPDPEKTYYLVRNGKMVKVEWPEGVDPEFSEGTKYYEAGSSFTCFHKLVEGCDWTAGEEIPLFIPTKDEERVEGKKYYEKVQSEEYEQLKLDIGVELAKEYLKQGTPVFSREDDWIKYERDDDVAKPGVYYYDDNDEHTYHPVEVGQSVKGLCSFYQKFESRDEAYVDAHLDEPYYILKKDQYREYTGEDIAGKYERQSILFLDYSKREAVNCIGGKFTYKSYVGAQVTQELTASGLIELSDHESQQVSISNLIAARKYLGRWFEYTYMQLLDPEAKRDNVNRPYYELKAREDGQKVFERIPEENLPGVDAPFNREGVYQERTLGVVISELNYPGFCDKIGVVLGETGDLSNEVYLKDSQLNRNYFALYQESLREQTRQVAEIRSLKEALAKLDVSNRRLNK